jgi:hypothetical protein
MRCSWLDIRVFINGQIGPKQRPPWSVCAVLRADIDIGATRIADQHGLHYELCVSKMKKLAGHRHPPDLLSSALAHAVVVGLDRVVPAGGRLPRRRPSAPGDCPGLNNPLRSIRPNPKGSTCPNESLLKRHAYRGHVRSRLIGRVQCPIFTCVLSAADPRYGSTPDDPNSIGRHAHRRSVADTVRHATPANSRGKTNLLPTCAEVIVSSRRCRGHPRRPSDLGSRMDRTDCRLFE